MTEYYNYITKDNDRWDLISYKYYNDSTLYEIIITANPDVEITPTLEAGIKLKIPVIETSDEITADLPPWRR